MRRRFLHSKIHRARVTETDINYVGSVTVDLNLLERAGMALNEQVEIYNITQGSRFTTYTIAGERGKGDICINGAAAHLVNKDDLVIIVTYCDLEENEMKDHQPIIIVVDENNQPVSG